MKRFALAALASLATMTVASAIVPAAAVAKPTFTPPEGFRLEKDGTLIHEASGTRFPLLFDGFTRTSNVALDPDGKNVSVVYTYGSGKQMVEARIALVKIMDVTAHEHYVALAPIVGRYFDAMRFTAVKPLGDGPITIEGVKPDHAWQGRFSALRQRTPYTLSLTTISRSHWDGRITAAYPTAAAPVAQSRILQLVTDIRETGPMK
jgi:hypothetical protein